MRALMNVPRFVWRPLVWAGGEWFSRRPNAAMTRWQYNASVVLGRAPTRAETAAAFRSWGRNLFESLTMHHLSAFDIRSRVVITPEERERLFGAFEQGAVAVLPHLGSWDLCGAWACVEGMPVSAVAEQLPPKEFQLFVDVRERLGFKVYGHKDTRAVVKLIHDIADRRLACLVADRDMSRHGVTVYWPTPTGPVAVTMPPGPAIVAQRAGARIVPIASRYLPGNLMRIRVGEVIGPLGSDDTIEDVTQQLCDFFAEHVASDVTDWHMLQRFFPPTPTPEDAR